MTDKLHHAVTYGVVGSLMAAVAILCVAGVAYAMAWLDDKGYGLTVLWIKVILVIVIFGVVVGLLDYSN